MCNQKQIHSDITTKGATCRYKKKRTRTHRQWRTDNSSVKIYALIDAYTKAVAYTDIRRWDTNACYASEQILNTGCDQTSLQVKQEDRERKWIFKDVPSTSGSSNWPKFGPRRTSAVKPRAACENQGKRKSDWRRRGPTDVREWIISCGLKYRENIGT